MVRAVCRVILVLAVLAGSAEASDLKTYIYDAQGRLIAVTRVTSGPSNYSGYVFDDADNRTRRERRVVPLPMAQNILNPDERLVPISSLRSADGRSTLTLQADGNLVVAFQGTAIWAPTPGIATGRAMVLWMQGDGNLVLYDPSFNALWSSGTGGNPGASLVLQNDCNLVINGSAGALWSSGSSC